MAQYVDDVTGEVANTASLAPKDDALRKENSVTGPGVHDEVLRVRLDDSNTEASHLLSATGARRYAHNWAVAQIATNH